MRPHLMPHRLTIRRNYLITRDERNNTIRSPGKTLLGVPARVDVRDSGEEVDNRDATRQLFDVELPVQWSGEELDLDAADELDFQGHTLKLRGSAILTTGTTGRPDHYELVAYRNVG